jgi:nitrate/TMAO reductase-like tetraheme cytochrome c subunit
MWLQALGRNLLALATAHWLSTLGCAMATGSAIVFAGASLFGMGVRNPYFGILLFLVMPAVFLAGLALIPIGLHLKSRTLGGYRKIVELFVWREGQALRLGILFVAVTSLNLVLLSAAAYQGADYLESDAFCGETCHSVMAPEYTAYLASPHAEAGCASCHLGPGVSWFAYHKLEGAGRVVSLISGDYSRPIPSIGGRTHPARETCGRCHLMNRSDRDTDKLVRFQRFDDDEASTERDTVLLMRVGAIHQAHAPLTIRYIAEDSSLEAIGWFAVGEDEYVGETMPTGETRDMDCIDCHNRTGHDFPLAEPAVDRALADGRLDRSRPYARRDALMVLTGDAPLPADSEVEANILARSVFEDMGVTWGSYPNHLGHETSPGCFRCHNYDLTNAGGESLGQDCFACHAIVAMDEAPENLGQLGF